MVLHQVQQQAELAHLQVQQPAAQQREELVAITLGLQLAVTVEQVEATLA